MAFQARMDAIFDQLPSRNKRFRIKEKQHMTQEMINQLSRVNKADKSKVVHARNNAEKTLLTVAIQFDLGAVVSYLLQNFTVDLNDPMIYFDLLPLHQACSSDAGSDIITVLIAKGADMNQMSMVGRQSSSGHLNYTPAWYAIIEDHVKPLRALLKFGLTDRHSVADMLVLSIQCSSVRCFELLASIKSTDHSQNAQILYQASLRGMTYVRPLLKGGYRFTGDVVRECPLILHDYYSRAIQEGEQIECCCAEFTTHVLSNHSNASHLAVDPSLILALLNRIIAVKKAPEKTSCSRLKAFYYDIEATLELVSYYFPTALEDLSPNVLEKFFRKLGMMVMMADEITMMLSLLGKMMKQGTRITEGTFEMIVEACRASIVDCGDEEGASKLGTVTCSVLHQILLQSDGYSRRHRLLDWLEQFGIVRFEHSINVRSFIYFNSVMVDTIYLGNVHRVDICRSHQFASTFIQLFTTEMGKFIDRAYTNNSLVLQLLETYVLLLCGHVDLEDERQTPTRFPVSKIAAMISDNSSFDKGDPVLYYKSTKILLLCFLYMLSQLLPHARYQFTQQMWCYLSGVEGRIHPPYQQHASILVAELLSPWEASTSLLELCTINIRHCLMQSAPMTNSLDTDPRMAISSASLKNKIEKCSSHIGAKAGTLPVPRKVQNLIIARESALKVTQAMRKCLLE